MKELPISSETLAYINGRVDQLLENHASQLPISDCELKHIIGAYLLTDANSSEERQALLEAKKNELKDQVRREIGENQIAGLPAAAAEPPIELTHKTEVKATPKVPKQRMLTKQGRAKISAAVKKMWAKKRAAQKKAVKK